MRGRDAADARERYDAWHARIGCDADSTTPWHEMIRAHVDEQRDLRMKRVLEIGCGRGEFACWIGMRPARPASVVAADFAAAAVTKGRVLGRRLGVSTVRWAIADIAALPWPTACFDKVISCETIEHVPRPAVAVRELARVLKPGGYLYLTTPNYFNIWAFYRVYLRLRGRRFAEAGQPINRFMLLPITCAMVRRAGLRLTAVDGVCHTVPMGPGRPALELPWLERARWLTRWVASQTLIVGRKP